MSNLQNYLRQHGEIREDIDFISNNLKNVNSEEGKKDLAKRISQLAGKLRIHLTSEDKYLYPNLKISEDQNIKKMAEKFENEMGGIAEKFQDYKSKYNVPSKISESIEEFKKDTIFIIKALGNRMEKEEKELYIKL